MDFSDERLLHAVRECLARVDGTGAGASGLCVALSGGLDSTVLVEALARLARSHALPALRAIHVDHGLHTDSAQWADSARRQATRLGLPLRIVRVDARPIAGESPEAVAREARYAALAGQLRADEMLCTAHHADDQLETILLQWLRGGGLRAIAGMPDVARFGQGWHARPLLGFTRSALEAWARAAGLDWLEDPSNRDDRFDRNYLRMHVLPALRRRWPAAARTVSRVAEHARGALELEAAIAAQDLSGVVEGETLVLGKLGTLPDARQRAVIRAWLRWHGLPVPPARTLGALLHDVRSAATDRTPRSDWPGATVHRYRGRLYAALPAPTAPRAGSWNWHESPVFELGDGSSLELVPDVAIGLSRARTPDVLEVTQRTGGERFRPAGAAHRRPLRKWLQEHGVLPWRRESLPVLRAAGEVLAIADICCAFGHAAAPGEPSWRIVWHGRTAVTEQEACGSGWREHPPID